MIIHIFKLAMKKISLPTVMFYGVIFKVQRLCMSGGFVFTIRYESLIIFSLYVI